MDTLLKILIVIFFVAGIFGIVVGSKLKNIDEKVLIIMAAFILMATGLYIAYIAFYAKII